MMNPYIGCGRAESQGRDQFRNIYRDLFTRKNGLSPGNYVPVNTFQSGSNGFPVESLHCGFGGLERAKSCDEILNIVNREVRLTVDLPVVWKYKVFGYQLVADFFEAFGRNHS